MSEGFVNDEHSDGGQDQDMEDVKVATLSQILDQHGPIKEEQTTPPDQSQDSGSPNLLSPVSSHDDSTVSQSTFNLDELPLPRSTESVNFDRPKKVVPIPHFEDPTALDRKLNASKRCHSSTKAIRSFTANLDPQRKADITQIFANPWIFTTKITQQQIEHLIRIDPTLTEPLWMMLLRSTPINSPVDPVDPIISEFLRLYIHYSRFFPTIKKFVSAAIVAPEILTNQGAFLPISKKSLAQLVLFMSNFIELSRDQAHLDNATKAGHHLANVSINSHDITPNTTETLPDFAFKYVDAIRVSTYLKVSKLMNECSSFQQSYALLQAIQTIFPVQENQEVATPNSDTLNSIYYWIIVSYRIAFFELFAKFAHDSSDSNQSQHGNILDAKHFASITNDNLPPIDVPIWRLPLDIINEVPMEDGSVDKETTPGTQDLKRSFLPNSEIEVRCQMISKCESYPDWRNVALEYQSVAHINISNDPENGMFPSASINPAAWPAIVLAPVNAYQAFKPPARINRNPGGQSSGAQSNPAGSKHPSTSPGPRQQLPYRIPRIVSPKTTAAKDTKVTLKIDWDDDM